MKRKLGALELQFFAYAQMRRLQTVRRSDLMATPLRMTDDQGRKLLSRLARAGLIARVHRDLYLVPPRLPLGGTWSPDEILALNTLMENRGGHYQICGPNAFNRYGFDQQIPTRVYAYNNRVSGRRTVGSVALTLIKVADSRLGHTEKPRTPDGLAAVYSSRTRTLVDAVYDWARFNSLPRAYDWIRRDLSAKRVTAEDLVTVTLKYGDRGTVRRIGAILEQVGVKPSLLAKLTRALPASTSLIPWNPTAPKRGKISRRWGVVLNEGW